MRVQVHGSFNPLIAQRTILRAVRQLLRRFSDDGTYDVPKHVGDLLTPDVYILVYVMLRSFVQVDCLRTVLRCRNM